MSNRGFPITQAHRDLRRKQAEARQAEYDKLSIQEKLNRLPTTGSVKQRARLQAALNKPVKAEVAAQMPVQDTVKQNNNQKKTKKEGN